jgi:hypothetical protein
MDPRLAVLAALMSLALAATHWLARPHLFSIIGAALTLMLLESSGRNRALKAIPLFILWANLHGAWLYGIVKIGTYVAGDLAEAVYSSDERKIWLKRARGDATMMLAGLVSVLLNPYGIRLYQEVFFAATSASLATNISEYLPPNFGELIEVPFLVAILSTVALFSLATKRIRYNWLFLILMSLFFALKSFRNIALFGVSAWPLIALHTARAWPRRDKPFRFFSEFARLDPHSRVGILIVPVAALMIAVGLNHGNLGSVNVIPDHFNAKKFPVAAVARLRAENPPGRVFDAWGWGGYIMYAWPEARLHVDPLKFNDTTIATYTIIEDLQPGWQREADRWGIKTIIVNTKSPTAKGLRMEPSWKVWFQDSTATVFRAADAGKS